MAVQMPVVWTPRHRGHRPNGGYWLGVRETGDEEPERGDALLEGLLSAGIRPVEPPDLGADPVRTVHDPDYVDFVSRAYDAWVAEGHLVDPGQPAVVPYLFAAHSFAARYRRGRRPATIRAEVGLYAMDTMTLITEGTFDAAVAAAGAAAHAADLAVGGGSAYAAVRPPGHHAGPAFYGGSCYFNNAAVAAERLRRSGAAERVAIIDIDAHQGNGTQEIFWDRDDVFYGSVHVDPADGWFPHIVGYDDETGAGPGAGWTLNRSVPAGSGDDRWLAALRLVVDAAAEKHPDALVVSLGVDAATSDPAAPLLVTADSFRAAGAMLAELGVTSVFVQEGGYDLATITDLVLAVLDGFETHIRNRPHAPR